MCAESNRQNDKSILLRRNTGRFQLLQQKHLHRAIYYIFHGNGALKIDGQNILLANGDVVLISPETVYDISCNLSVGEYIQIQVNTDELEQILIPCFHNETELLTKFQKLIQTNHNVKGFIFRMKEQSGLSALLSDIWKEAENNEKYCSQLLKLKIVEIFFIILRSYEDTLVIPAGAFAAVSETAPSVLFDGNQNAVTAKALAMIGQQYNTITLKGMADSLGYSAKQMGRLLKQYTGRSYTELVGEYKLNTALSLLESGDYSIAEIADMVGFSEVSHFYAAFKKYVGVPPGEYRQKIKRNVLNSQGNLSSLRIV